MGLDICCGDEFGSMGSYSGVQEIRREWIEAAIKYCKSMPLKPSEHPDDEDDEDNIWNGRKNTLTKNLRKVVKTKNLNYDAFEKLAGEMKYFGLYGVYVWVNHSDCEGYLSPGESFDILKTIKSLKSFLDGDSDYLEDLARVLEESVQTYEPVMFC